ncbi:MAG: hypothetical protein JNJ54_23175 [Myxococcaceae bacterium]|nr:hypothetical protein [Myxococcaceae bacterium]
MSARLAVLVSLSILTSACGPDMTAPTITLSKDDAVLEKRSGVWFLVTPVRFSNGSGVQQRFGARVKEKRGGFLTDPAGTTTTFHRELPPKLTLPLNAQLNFPVGTEVVLTLDVMAQSWDGVSDFALAVRTQDYSFIQR